MRRWTIAAMAALGLAAALHGSRQPVEQVARAKGWFTSYAAARAAAQKSGKPLLVVFRCQP
ncbi:MAG: hypothetical protein IT429_19325 [Gemmataceae bacterium]|nr:hypothetical protein [Gemmataceae bacterium]